MNRACPCVSQNGLRSLLSSQEPTSRQRNPYMDWWLRKWRLLLYTARCLIRLGKIDFADAVGAMTPEVCLLVASVGNTAGR